MTRKQEFETISRIANRALSTLQSAGVSTDKLSAIMDLDYTNQVCPLDLGKLESFDDANFTHDIIGIYRHFNRATKQLDNCFVPRCALPEPDDSVGNEGEWGEEGAFYSNLG